MVKRSLIKALAMSLGLTIGWTIVSWNSLRSRQLLVDAINSCDVDIVLEQDLNVISQLGIIFGINFIISFVYSIISEYSYKSQSEKKS